MKIIVCGGNDALGYLAERPVDGFVMAPTPDLPQRAASIICGHEFIQRLTVDEQAEFENFVKDVLRTQYL